MRALPQRMNRHPRAATRGHITQTLSATLADGWERRPSSWEKASLHPTRPQKAILMPCKITMKTFNSSIPGHR